jgi:hypothetical protein
MRYLVYADGVLMTSEGVSIGECDLLKESLAKEFPGSVIKAFSVRTAVTDSLRADEPNDEKIGYR